MTWLGLWLSLNASVPCRPFALRPAPAAEATAVVQVGKLTLTAIYVQPLRAGDPPIASFGVGLKVF